MLLLHSTGEANALFTEDVPPSDAPIFAATATHCILLPAGKEPTPELLGAVGAQQGTQAAGNDAQQGVVGQLQGQQEGSVSQPEARLVFEVCGITFVTHMSALGLHCMQ
jgi:hypothetical protein